MTRFLSRRHTWQPYQRLIVFLKQILGARLFYRIKNIRQILLGPVYRARRQRIQRHLQKREKTILVIDHQLPCFDCSSGENRMDSILRLLSDMGYAVSFIAENQGRKPVYEKRLEQAGVRILHESIKKHLKQNGSAYGTVILCRPYIGQAYIHMVEKEAPQASIVFDTVDLHHVRLAREADITKSEPLRAEAKRMEEIELHLMELADCTIVVSDAERLYLQKKRPEFRVCTLSNIHEETMKPILTSERSNLLFVGNFYHTPNEDGIRWFVKDILPIIQKNRPGTVLDIVGYGSDVFVNDLANSFVRVHGHQPFLKPFFADARVCIAPLRFGAGVKGKISMAIAEGVPCVTTTIGAEGMQLVNGRTAEITDNAAGFAEAVIRLFRDDEVWMQIATFAQKEGLNQFSKETARAAIQEMFAMIHA